MLSDLFWIQVIIIIIIIIILLVLLFILDPKKTLDSFIVDLDLEIKFYST